MSSIIKILHSKLKCDRQLPCHTCLKRGWQDSCAYGSDFTGPRGRRRTRVSNVQPVLQPAEPTLDNIVLEPQPQIQVQPQQAASSPSPTPEPIQERWDTILRRPLVERRPVGLDAQRPTVTLSLGPTVPMKELLALLPPASITEYLVVRYFGTLSSIFHIIHGPTFQKQFLAFTEAPEKTSLSWLALLFAILALTLETIKTDDAGLTLLWQDPSFPRDLRELSQKFRNAAMMSLSQDQFLVRHDLDTLEALLILVYMISHNEGPEYAWALLGTALNIATALRCHTNAPISNCIERERHRRCWAGILIIHTDQSLCFRDIDLTYLLKMTAAMPAWVNDIDIQEHGITESPTTSGSQFTDMTLIKFQVRLFQLSTEICSHISSSAKFDETLLLQHDAAVAKEQREWDTVYLVNGNRSILNTEGYVHWCTLQTYAHQLYLLLHRPFHSSRSNHFRAESRDKCIKSGLALLDIHHQFFELPRLKCYRWLVKGAISCNSLHGAVALTSCMLDMPESSDLTEHISAIDAAVTRMEALKTKSPACSNVYRVLRCLRSYLKKREPEPTVLPEDVELRFEDWANNVDWFRPDAIDWVLWDQYITPESDYPQNIMS
ncbi:transcription factor [Fusarium longipes]|uniref:Transcription factor n=1 Tax=Fusarium longipes TaxID=694270 RepID=A0A395SXF1_9HYPO|nr:transcription factor [Fusarium longipes]